MSSFGNRKIDSERLDFFEEITDEALSNERGGLTFGEAAALEKKEVFGIEGTECGGVATADIIGFDFKRGERGGPGLAREEELAHFLVTLGLGCVFGNGE